MIITHANPDFDCIVATWLLKRFCGMTDAEVKFIKFGETIPVIPQNAVFVDIGKRDFDHHHRIDFVSAATLVLNRYNLDKDPILKQLANIARNIDHGLADDRTDGLLNLTDVISGLNKLYPHDPSEVLKIAFKCLDAIYKQASTSIDFDKEFKKGIKFKTQWGPGIGIETHNKGLRGYCHKQGFIVFVYVDPVTQYRGFASPGGKGVDFSNIYEKLKKLEPVAEWYLHFSKDLLICGSDKALNKNLSKLKLTELIELVTLND